LDDVVVSSRNLYPPRVNDSVGTYTFLHHYAWEESGLPAEWVQQFNLHLDGITCLSSHVMKVLQDNGVATPLSVSGCGVDHWERVTPAETSFAGKAFRFLHVSSCFPRKGADVLLKSYGKAFRGTDDVTLIIKTFKNPHNDIASQLAAERAADPEFPDVVLIFDDLTDPELKALYRHCHVLVAPSRAEGYGLPLAEAMLSGLPVITTNWSGQLDFCNDETAWLVDYRFAPAQTHFGLSAPVWAEPDCEHLQARLREAFFASQEERASKAATGRRLLLKDHTWTAVARRYTAAIEHWTESPTRARPHIGWVTTWNCACGIANHSKHLLQHVPNKVTVFGAINDQRIQAEDNAIRSWQKDLPSGSIHQLDQLAADADHAGVDAIVIQFNYSFFDFRALSAFVAEQKAKGRTVTMLLHATVDPPEDPTRRLSSLADTFRLCDRVLVHSHHDLNRLKAIGVIANATLIPLGIVNGLPIAFEPAGKSDCFTIGSYGFCLPHKGLRSLVAAFDLLANKDPSLRLHMVNALYPIDVSHQLAQQIRDDINHLNRNDRIRVTSEYLSDAESLAHLRDCDLIVFPYEKTGESASAAVRFGIASGRPVVTTDLPIFDDVRPAVFQVESSDPGAMARGMQRIIAALRTGDQEVAERAKAADKWRRDHSYETLAARLSGLIEAIQRARAMPPAAFDEVPASLSRGTS
jgi:glycosyltransferase involved in cell wall biosynthesis